MSELISLLPAGGISRFAWDLAWQSTLIGIVALISLRFFVRHPAARAWFVVLATGLSVAIPLVSVVVRANGLGLLVSERHVVVAAKPATAFPPRPPIVSSPAEMIAAVTNPPDDFVDTETDPQAGITTVTESGRTSGAQDHGASFDPTWLWRGLLVVAAAGWAILAIAGLARLICGFASVCRLCRDAVDCDNVMILGSCRRAAKAIGLRCEPQVAISPRTGCPTVLAWGRPRLFIPPIAGRKTAHQWYSVFTHELAHVHRGDGWSQLAMEVAVVLLPWQPLIRVLQNIHRQACEEACDDWALFAGADPIDYASTLTEWIPTEPQVGALDIGIGTRSVHRRIIRLLACSTTPQPRLGGGWLVGSGTVALSVLFLLALMQSGTARTLDDPQVATTTQDKSDGTRSLDIKPAKASENRVRPVPRLVAVLGEGRRQHWNSAKVLGFGPQHRSLISHSVDGTLKVWDVDSGIELRGMDLPPSTSGHRWWDWDLATRQRHSVDVKLSPDGHVLFIGKADGTIEMLDAASFKLQRTLMIPGELPKMFAISSDGKRLAAVRLSTANHTCAAIVLDLASGQVVGEIQEEIPKELQGTASAPWRCLALSPDGSQLAVGRNGDATLWDVATGSLLGEFDGGWNLCFSPDGKTLVGYSPDRQLNLWNLATGDLRTSIPGFATSSQFAFDPSGATLAIVDRSRVRLHRVDTGEALWTTAQYQPTRHFTRPSVAFHNNGKLLAASSGHGVVLFDAVTGQELGQDSAAAITALAVNPTDRQLATGDSFGQLTTWDIASGEQQRTWGGHTLGVNPIAFSPDGRTLASAAFEHLVTWNMRNGRLQHTLQPLTSRGSSPVTLQMSFGPHSNHLYVGYQSRELTKWNVATGHQEGALQVAPNVLTRSPFVMTRDHQLIADARGEPRGLGIWDLATGNQVKHLTRFGTRQQLAVSQDGQRVAAGARGDKISVWNLAQDTQVDILKGHRPGYLSGLAFNPNGKMLASGGDDGKVQMWDAATGEHLDTFQIGPRRGIIDQLEFSADGRYLISKNGNGTVAILQVDSFLLAQE